MFRLVVFRTPQPEIATFHGFSGEHNMTFEHKKLGRLRLIQSMVHSSLWLVVTQKTWDAYQNRKKTTVRIREASTVIGDQTAMLSVA
eukprot:2036683-Amphidinium_carterae.1